MYVIGVTNSCQYLRKMTCVPANFPPAHLDTLSWQSDIRQRWRNYNAFLARLMAAHIFTTTQDRELILKHANYALTNAFEPAKSKWGPPRPAMLTPEARAGHIPAAVEWLRHAAPPIWAAVGEDRLAKDKQNSKGVVKPEWRISSLERWKAWKGELSNIAAEEKFGADVQSVAAEGLDAMNAAEGSGK